MFEVWRCCQLLYCISIGNSRPSNKSPPMPRRSPPPPPSSGEPSRDRSQNSVASKTGGGAGQLGAFWSTQYAKESSSEDNNEPKFDEEPTSVGTVRHDRNRSDKTQTQTSHRNSHGPSKEFEISFFSKRIHITTLRSQKELLLGAQKLSKMMPLTALWWNLMLENLARNLAETRNPLLNKH